MGPSGSCRTRAAEFQSSAIRNLIQEMPFLFFILLDTSFKGDRFNTSILIHIQALLKGHNLYRLELLWNGVCFITIGFNLDYSALTFFWEEI